MATVTNGASTTSRRPDRMLTHLKATQAKGCRVHLDGGRWYHDWQMGLAGPLFSYAPDWWVNALQNAVRDGGVTSIASSDERRVAAMLSQFYPDIDQVRWCVNGSDGCAAAVKLARAYTNRDDILCRGYHGWASAYCPGPNTSRPNLGERAMNLGTMQAERDAYHELKWLDPDMNSKVVGIRPAAVIIECPPMDFGRDEASSWLRDCAKACRANGILFVLDEVVTGFRYGPGGASEYYGLTGMVDLYCFGKTIGNGFPIAAIAGKAYIMQYLAGVSLCVEVDSEENEDITAVTINEGQVHFSGTFFGGPIGLAAAKATLTRLHEDPPWEHNISIGRFLIKQWNELGLPWKMAGHPTRPIIYPDPEGQKKFIDLRHYLLREGHIFVSHPLYTTTALTVLDISDLCKKAGQWASKWGE